jgi:hypothetical protein
VTAQPDPIVVVRVAMPKGPPGTFLYGLCARSTAAKLAADAGRPDAIGPGEVADLGPSMILCQVYERKRAWLGAGLLRLGVADAGGRWLAWFLPSLPPEPPPGSPGAAAQYS